MEKAKGGNPNLSPRLTGSGPKTLTQLGISREQSSDWQRLASVPAETFERELATQSCHPIASPAIIRAAEILPTMGKIQITDRRAIPVVGRSVGKGVNMEWQTNALHWCTRPRVLLKGKRT